MTVNEAIEARSEVVHALHGYVMDAFVRINSEKGINIDEFKVLPSLLYVLLKEPLGNWVDEGEPHV